MVRCILQKKLGKIISANDVGCHAMAQYKSHESNFARNVSNIYSVVRKKFHLLRKEFVT